MTHDEGYLHNLTCYGGVMYKEAGGNMPNFNPAMSSPVESCLHQRGEDAIELQACSTVPNPDHVEVVRRRIDWNLGTATAHGEFAEPEIDPEARARAQEAAHAEVQQAKITMFVRTGHV